MGDGVRVLITGGAGFIGSAVARQFIGSTEHDVAVVDNLSYASNRESLAAVADSDRFRFEKVDIREGEKIASILTDFRPDSVLHLAAESHVDRSVDAPLAFVDTNLSGTAVLLEAVRAHWGARGEQSNFRFVHVSTDEVYGSLGPKGYFNEDSHYRPNSPYAASKAGSDHLVRAWHRTYGMPVIVTNCSNNLGPFQFPEKLIPLIISKSLAGEPLPIYGTGGNVRDWLYVEDHADALRLILARGSIGETYAIGGENERTNLDVVRTICAIMDELLPDSPHRPHAEKITFVTDRPGHDARYAIDSRKLRQTLGWVPRETFDSALRKTV